METNSRIFVAGCPGWGNSPGAPLITFLRYWICALVLGVMGTGYSPAGAQAATDGSQSATVTDQSAITIGPGDLFDLTVFDVPELMLKGSGRFKRWGQSPFAGRLEACGHDGSRFATVDCARVGRPPVGEGPASIPIHRRICDPGHHGIRRGEYPGSLSTDGSAQTL